jgi:hypothetical protein
MYAEISVSDVGSAYLSSLSRTQLYTIRISMPTSYSKIQSLTPRRRDANTLCIPCPSIWPILNALR